ncbi:MAG: hypothetical protein GEU28_07690 [Dehalococcoidia bacterium]|nr:hypothetical protein [Dehalococcoidia bacterium]
MIRPTKPLPMRSDQLGGLWRSAIIAVAGLLLAIAIGGALALTLDRRLQAVTREVIDYDLEIDDEGDELRVAVLELRTLHRGLLLAGPSRGGIDEFDATYAILEEELSELDAIGIEEPGVTPSGEIRDMARSYHDDFRSALLSYERTDPEFIDAADRGLVRLNELNEAAQEIDRLGEELSDDSLEAIEQTSETTALVLTAMIVGLFLAGGGMAFIAIGVVRELRDLYARQAAAAEELARASRAKNEFIADVSHELRTPLTVVRGNAEIALSSESEQRDSLEEILRASSRMTRLVEDLMFLARSDSATLPLDLKSVEVATFLPEVLENARSLARERGARLESRIAADGRIMADRGRIEQAILILVDNAAKFSPENGVVTLEATNAAGARELCVKVTDEGPGIAPADVPYIFERFYRVGGQRARREGTGLGLAIAHTISSVHGGRIEVRSQQGHGTAMLLSLPLLDEPRPSIRRPARAT